MLLACQCRTILLPLPRSVGPILALYHCHCTECRKQSASAFGTTALFPADALFPLPPDTLSKLGVWTRPTDTARTMDCYFCKTCGVRVIHRIREKDGSERGTVSVKAGCLEEEEGDRERGQVVDWKRAKHIYTRSAVVHVPEGVERWEAAPDDGLATGNRSGDKDEKAEAGEKVSAEELEEIERTSPVCLMRF